MATAQTNMDVTRELALVNPGGKLQGLARLVDLVVNALPAAESRRAYRTALVQFFNWYGESSHKELTRAVIHEYVRHLEERELTAGSINVKLAAIRKMIWEAAENGMMSRSEATELASVKDMRMSGTRVGRWLTADEVKELLNAPDIETDKGKRDRAMLAVLFVCGLRRAELVNMVVRHIQRRDGRWLIVDIQGKGRRVRTVALPLWVKELLNAWTDSAGISDGRVFRGVNKGGAVQGEGLSPAAVWLIVQGYARVCGLGSLSPHDCRRTCAKLCRAADGDLEQIQFLLGHASIKTTERYLGGKQDLTNAVNDRILGV